MFPLSRPELPSQLKAVDPNLARLLELLMTGDTDAVNLREGESLVMHRIKELSDEPR